MKRVEATVILSKCSKTHKTYGIRAEKKEDGKWHLTWIFKIDDEKAKKEGYQNTKVFGDILVDDTYRGCPYCETMYTSVCDRCGMLSCRDPHDTKMVCGWCGSVGEIGALPDEFELKGGEM